MAEETKAKDASRECGKGETIRRGADIQKYVDNYDKIFRHSAAKSAPKKSKKA